MHAVLNGTVYADGAYRYVELSYPSEFSAVQLELNFDVVLRLTATDTRR